MSADALYARWQHALRLTHYAPLHGTEDQAAAREQAAWDAFRDACEIENPNGSCLHPECPQLDPEPPSTEYLCVTCDVIVTDATRGGHEGHTLLRSQTLVDDATDL